MQKILKFLKKFNVNVTLMLKCCTNNFNIKKFEYF